MTPMGDFPGSTRSLIYLGYAKLDPGYNVFSFLPWVVRGYNPLFDYENDHIG